MSSPWELPTGLPGLLSLALTKRCLEALYTVLVVASPVLPSPGGSLSLPLPFVAVLQQLLPSLEDALLACLRRSSVPFARPFSAHHWKCSFSLKGPGPGVAKCH